MTSLPSHMETTSIDEFGLEAASPPLSADEEREDTVKDHGRSHHEVSDLVSVEGFKRTVSNLKHT